MKLIYFAWIRQRIGQGGEQVSPPAAVATVADLIAWLAGRGPEYAHAFEAPEVVRAAVNQRHVDHDHPVAAGDEVAFFPPVTGG